MKVELVGKGDKKTLVVVPGSIVFLKSGTYLRPLSDKVPVHGPDGEQLTPSGEFFITSETFDPYHLLIDVLNGNRPF